jgi:exopolyphosphatase/guanosine-5'-triphosphate,3'-diphosphate pyrophosphatase
MPVVSPPLLIAALDAGSNAIRAVVARAASATEIRELASARWPVRLGHGAFTRKQLDPRTMTRAVEVFWKFRNLLDRYDVGEYYAVATSAVREAANREALISRIRRETGVELAAIDAHEEARLARVAVFSAATSQFAPRAIVDLGGGSLDISFLRGRRVVQNLDLPLGSVRLMETYDLAGSFTPNAFARLRRHVVSVLKSHGRAAGLPARRPVVACGGNAEALARLAPGQRLAGFNTINLSRLDERLWEIVRLDVEDRMAAFGVRRDRAEVIGVAAVVLAALGEWLGASHLVVPAVGVREGILHDLAAAHFGPATANDERAEGLRQQARRFAARMHSDAAHCEQVRRLAAQLFDQLAPVHGLPPGLRVSLEMGALLHDVGRAVNARAHHKHGEYLVRHADIPGLGKHQQAMVACLVRYHGKATPEPHHRQYRSLAPAERKRVRQLAGLLQIAVAFDSGDAQTVRRLEVKIQKKDVRVRIFAALEAFLDFRQLRRKARLLEKECSVRVRFDRGRWQPSTAERSSRGEQTALRTTVRSASRRAALPRTSAA